MSATATGLAPVSVQALGVSERAAFLQRTYVHLLGAVLALVGFEVALFQLGFAQRLASTLLGGRFTWLIVMVAFMAVSHVAHRWASSPVSIGKQYLGLGLYTFAEGIILAPLLYFASMHSDESLIPSAVLATLLLFAGLTAVVFISGKDFNFLKAFLHLGYLAAIGIFFCGWIFGFQLGIFFAFGMAGLVSGTILVQTSNVMKHYRSDQHVAAALGLFASLATLFWYVLQILMALQDRR